MEGKGRPLFDLTIALLHVQATAGLTFLTISTFGPAHDMPVTRLARFTCLSSVSIVFSLFSSQFLVPLFPSPRFMSILSYTVIIIINFLRYSIHSLES